MQAWRARPWRAWWKWWTMASSLQYGLYELLASQRLKSVPNTRRHTYLIGLGAEVVLQAADGQTPTVQKTKLIKPYQ